MDPNRAKDVAKISGVRNRTAVSSEFGEITQKVQILLNNARQLGDASKLLLEKKSETTEEEIQLKDFLLRVKADCRLLWKHISDHVLQPAEQDRIRRKEDLEDDSIQIMDLKVNNALNEESPLVVRGEELEYFLKKFQTVKDLTRKNLIDLQHKRDQLAAELTASIVEKKQELDLPLYFRENLTKAVDIEKMADSSEVASPTVCHIVELVILFNEMLDMVRKTRMHAEGLLSADVVKKLMQEKRDLQKQIMAFRQKLEKAEAKNGTSEYTAGSSKVAFQLQELKATIRSLESELRKTREQRISLQNQNGQLEDNCQMLRNRYNNVVSDARQRAALHAGESRKLEKRIEDLQTEHKGIGSQVQLMSSMYSSAADDMTNMTKRMKEKDEEIARLTDATQQIMNRLQNSRKIQKTKEKICLVAMAAKEESDKIRIEAQDNLARANRSIEKRNEKIKLFQERMNGLSDIIAERNKQIMDQKAERGDLLRKQRELIEDAKNEAEKYEKQIDDIRTDFEAEDAKHGAQMAQLRIELRRSKEDHKFLRDSNERLEKRLADAEEKLKKSKQ
eukprot:TRINITY_DN15725_c0_g1_i1.p1 TRINITY_DN15725_c0_g1~~TRINITY_DN15725_c0_g1_i1.p1  ORF type:complete len:563 (-),score=157.15 TRINITY_DN15725_c0_g1_i1:119-1807(-)